MGEAGCVLRGGLCLSGVSWAGKGRQGQARARAKQSAAQIHTCTVTLLAVLGTVKVA